VFENSNVKKNDTLVDAQQKTDVFAIISLAAGAGGFIILPIIFAPIGFIASWVSYYRLKENKELKGNGLRIAGAILGGLNIAWLLHQYKIIFNN
jgi:hypothetical protein